MNPDDDIKPDLSKTPLAYTAHEVGKFRPWDEPPIGTANAIIWEDGRRWDRVNGFTDSPWTPQNIADLKEEFRTEAAGETWWCSVHNQRAGWVNNGKHCCPPDSDAQPLGVPCVATIAEVKDPRIFKTPERTRHYDPQPDVDPDAAGKTVMVGFSVVSKTFSHCVNIIAEAMPPKMNNAEIQKLLRKALEVGHGITFGAEENPTLFFVISQDQKDALSRVGIHNATWCQLIGTAEACGLTAEAATARFRALKENQ